MTDWWGHFLEIGNGVLAIASAWLSIFLAYHLVKVGAQRRVWTHWSRLPTSMQLAVAIFTAAVGTFIASGAIWASRYVAGGALMAGPWGGAGIWIGRVLAAGGFLCALRIVTRPMSGAWPWVGAMGSIGAYLLWSLFRFI